MDDIHHIIAVLKNMDQTKSVIYRGETQDFNTVSSNLNRKIVDLLLTNETPLQIGDPLLLQQLIAEDCQRYLDGPSDPETTLWELQHHGGYTNLIDFTSNYLIALYFASESSFHKPGRIICLPNVFDEAYEIQKPSHTLKRAEHQHSIFVQAPTGFIPAHKYTVVEIPCHLKQNILDYLWQQHGIFAKTVYSDIHGYISHQKRHLDSWFYACIGQQYIVNGDYQTATEQFTLAIQNYYHWPAAYNLRGYSHALADNHHSAITDFSQAIQLDTQHALAFCNRGASYMNLDEHEPAIQDYHEALELNSSLEGAHIGLGWAYNCMDQTDKSCYHFCMATKLAPDNILTWSHTGGWHLLNQRIDLAIQAFNNALSVKSDSVIRTSNHPRSIHNVDVDQVRADVFLNHGAVFWYMHDLEKTIDNVETAEKLGQIPEAFCKCGLVFLVMQEWDQALKFLSCAKDLEQDIGKMFISHFRSLNDCENQFHFELQGDIRAFLQQSGVPN